MGEQNKEDLYSRIMFHRLEHLLKFSYNESELFDKSILTLAAGVFSVSLTFIKQIPHSYFIKCLLWSWSCYVASIFITLISMLLSQLAIAKDVDYTQECMLEKENKDKEEENNYPKTITIFVTILNWLSIVSFVLGSILLARFVYINLLKGL